MFVTPVDTIDLHYYVPLPVAFILAEGHKDGRKQKFAEFTFLYTA